MVRMGWGAVRGKRGGKREGRFVFWKRGGERAPVRACVRATARPPAETLGPLISSPRPSTPSPHAHTLIVASAHWNAEARTTGAAMGARGWRGVVLRSMRALAQRLDECQAGRGGDFSLAGRVREVCVDSV